MNLSARSELLGILFLRLLFYVVVLSVFVVF